MNRLVVWLVGLAAPLWRALGADPVALKLILQARLRMADRGGVILGKKQGQSNYVWLMYLVLFFMGFLVAAAFFVIPHTPTAMGLAYSFLLVYLGLVLVMEMSETLFDQRDLYLLMSRPVNDVTFSLSRALSVATLIGKYLFVILLPLGLALPFLAHPLLLIPHFLGGLLLLVLLVGGTLALYLTLLRRVPPARFRKMMGYAQMVLSILFVFVYLSPNIGDFTGVDPKSVEIVGTPWGVLFPGLWLGAIWGYGGLLTGKVWYWIQLLLGVGAAAGALLYFVRQSRGYGDRLLTLSLTGSGEEDGPSAASKAEVGESPWRDRLSHWLTRPGLERASFHFHWAMMLRTMSFKQRVYPSLVFVPIMIFVFFLRDVLTDGTDLAANPTQLLIGLYYIALSLITPLTNARITEHPERGWIWEVTPYSAQTGPMAYGQLAAATAQFLIPTVIVVYPAFLYLAGWSFLDDILLSLGANYCGILLFQFTDKTPPFSKNREEGGFASLGPIMLVFFLAALTGLGHWALTYVPYAVSGAAVLAWVGVVGLVRGLRGRVGEVA